jgi:hypothetical protein
MEHIAKENPKQASGLLLFNSTISNTPPTP